MSASALRGNLLVALGYVALAGLVMAFFELPAPWWPSTGLAVFAILAGGVRWMPGVALGSWLANDLLMGWGTAGAVWVTLGNVLGPVLGMALFRRAVSEVKRPFDTALGVAAFFLLLGGLNALVSAAFGATGVAFIEGQGEAVLVPTFMRWMIGDISSAVLLAPVFYLWWRDPRPRVPVHGWFEATASASLLFGLTAWAFFQPMEGPVASGLVPLILLPLIWIALRASLRDAYTLLAVAFLIMLAGTLLGRGPFAALGAEQAMTALQLRIVVLGAIVLLASALDGERRRAMHALAELNAHLEERVAERTALIEASRERLRQIVESLPSPMVMSRAEQAV
ncbi:MAG: MASE1 domain-containing protein [Pseudomonadota bacterium]